MIHYCRHVLKWRPKIKCLQQRTHRADRLLAFEKNKLNESVAFSPPKSLWFLGSARRLRPTAGIFSYFIFAIKLHALIAAFVRFVRFVRPLSAVILCVWEILLTCITLKKKVIKKKSS